MTDADVPFLTVISERPTDRVAWQHYAQWLAERGEVETSVYLLRDCDIFASCIRSGWRYICEIRSEARAVSDYALQIVDYLLPHFRWPDTKAHATEDVRGLPVAEIIEEEE